MKLYHYSRLDDWEQIKKGSYLSNDQPGLGASHRVGTAYDEAWNTGAIWALLDPNPVKWTDNGIFRNAMNALMCHTGKLLLEIEVNPLNPNCYAIDWAHMEAFLREKGNLEIPKKYQHANKRDAEKAYFGGRIQLSEYLRDPAVHDFELPEIIITENVPFEHITIAKQQNKIAKELQSLKGQFRQRLVYAIEDVPELMANDSISRILKKHKN